MKNKFIEIKLDEAVLKVPKDKEVIDKIIKMLDIYSQELNYELPDLPKREEIDSTQFEVFEEETGNKEEPLLNKPFDSEIPPIQPKQEDIPMIDNSKICPLCSSKLKRKRIKRVGDSFKQIVKCKKWSCPFEKEIEVKI